MTAYLTGSFGDTDVLFSPDDGDDRNDTATLPPDAHTHLSWAFTTPGVYTLHLQASLRTDERSGVVDLGTTDVRFAVGVDPSAAGRGPVLDAGHADIAVDLDSTTGDRFSLRSERTAKNGSDEVRHDDPADAIVAVPNTALKPIPAGPGFRFLGNRARRSTNSRKRSSASMCTVRSTPHLWQDVRNAQAYVKVIRDSLAAQDPQHADQYRRNAAEYLDTLTRLDDRVRKTIASIPKARRHLVTTHDAFAYLAKAVRGACVWFRHAEPGDRAQPGRPPTSEPDDQRAPHLSSVPRTEPRGPVVNAFSVADEQGVAICPIYGDTFGPDVHSYVRMMRFNARSLHDCLT